MVCLSETPLGPEQCDIFADSKGSGTFCHWIVLVRLLGQVQWLQDSCGRCGDEVGPRDDHHVNQPMVILNVPFEGARCVA